MCSSRCSLSAEGEVGSPWLQDTGLPGLLGGQGLDGDHQGLLSTLTQTQRAAVRRLDVYTRSTQRRHEAPAGGVRDIFGGFSSTVSEWRKSYCRTCLPGASARPPHPKCDSDSVAGLCWGVCVCVCVCVYSGNACLCTCRPLCSHFPCRSLAAMGSWARFRHLSCCTCEGVGTGS